MTNELDNMMISANTKILFLEVDGVLNSHEHTRSLPIGNQHRDGSLDPVALWRLARVVKETGCKIVVTSATWKHRGVGVGSHLIKALDSFEPTGVVASAIIGATPKKCDVNPVSPETVTRKDEINAWIDENEFSGEFVVLDWACGDDMGNLSDKVVCTTFETGLTDVDADLIIELLRPKSSVITGMIVVVLLYLLVASAVFYLWL